MLPPWAQGSPYRYSKTMKEALESNWVSGTINGWSDLIFGYKQRGKEAEKAWNVYPGLSQEPIKILAKAAEDQKNAFRLQAYHWGQTPMQIMIKVHPERVIKNNKVVYSIFDQNSCPDAYSVIDSKHINYGKTIKIFTSENPFTGYSFILVTIDVYIL